MVSLVYGLDDLINEFEASGNANEDAFDANMVDVDNRASMVSESQYQLFVDVMSDL